jgi:hypothetical protein
VCPDLHPPLPIAVALFFLTYRGRLSTRFFIKILHRAALFPLGLLCHRWIPGLSNISPPTFLVSGSLVPPVF